MSLEQDQIIGHDNSNDDDNNHKYNNESNVNYNEDGSTITRIIKGQRHWNRQQQRNTVNRYCQLNNINTVITCN